MKPNACYSTKTIEDESGKLFEITIEIDGMKFISKASSKNKARIKASKKAIKYFDPDRKHFFF
jgi:hypothetical protein